MLLRVKGVVHAFGRRGESNRQHRTSTGGLGARCRLGGTADWLSYEAQAEKVWQGQDVDQFAMIYSETAASSAVLLEFISSYTCSTFLRILRKLTRKIKQVVLKVFGLFKQYN